MCKSRGDHLGGKPNWRGGPQNKAINKNNKQYVVRECKISSSSNSNMAYLTGR